MVQSHTKLKHPAAFAAGKAMPRFLVEVHIQRPGGPVAVGSASAERAVIEIFTDRIRDKDGADIVGEMIQQQLEFRVGHIVHLTKSQYNYSTVERYYK